jgi:phospholipid/cholesterol/gamma-HCH transport system substrate-binding protein
MMEQRAIEIAVGVFVAIGLAALVMLAMKVSNITALVEQEGYDVKARFENIGGLKARAPVTMAGVRIGRVADIQFDDKTFEAVVTMRIYSQHSTLPTDTSAGIFTSGVLGENYVGLEPGGEMDNLQDGDEITLTQSAMVLENLVGKLLFEKAAGE